MGLEYIGAPGRTRTLNLLIRSQTLYPIELRALSYPKSYSNERLNTRQGSVKPLLANDFSVYLLISVSWMVKELIVILKKYVLVLLFRV